MTKNLVGTIIALIIAYGFASTASASDLVSPPRCDKSYSLEDGNTVSDSFSEAERAIVRMHMLARLCCELTYSYVQRSALDAEYQALKNYVDEQGDNPPVDPSDPIIPATAKYLANIVDTRFLGIREGNIIDRDLACLLRHATKRAARRLLSCY